MVVKFRVGKSMNGALTYNEKKLHAGQASILLASRFGGDIGELSFAEKIRRFSLVNQRCTRVKNNTVHLILSFSPEDMISTSTMQAITIDYMQRIGFGNQPYIVYLHSDTGNKHLHIVTTPIQKNGRSINCHNIVQRLCQPARQAIEQQYQLIPAQGRNQSQTLPFQSSSLSNTIREVVSTYKFSNLDELNAVLLQYGYMASVGKPGSRQFLNGGIQYSKVDENGQKTGVPVNASAIYTNPGLAYLQKQFAKNSGKLDAAAYYQQLQNSWLAASRKYPLLTLTAFLQKMKISIHQQKDQTGQITHITLVDHYNRAVYSYPPKYLPKVATATQDDIATVAERYSENNLQSGILAMALLQNLLYAPTTTPEISPEFLKKKRRPKL